jgi:catechol 2,3-dioxygenase-like lactoylglutathione lyase family enzyme
MKNCTTLIAVRDMERSLRFYKDLFQQEVTLDLGWNKTLACGLALQEHFDEIAGFPADTMMFHSNTMELYFETEDFDGFIALLDQYPDVERLHEAKTFPWLQRGIRIFDPDGHLIEVSESMYCVACGQFRQGKSVEETAQLTQHPLDIVQEWYRKYQTSNISVCGTDCSTCGCYGTMCSGCNACEGKVFHAPEGCAIYRCTIGEKHLKNCGECKEAPCSIWRNTRDPKYSDEEFEQNIAARMQSFMLFLPSCAVGRDDLFRYVPPCARVSPSLPCCPPRSCRLR